METYLLNGDQTETQSHACLAVTTESGSEFPIKDYPFGGKSCDWNADLWRKRADLDVSSDHNVFE